MESVLLTGRNQLKTLKIILQFNGAPTFCCWCCHLFSRTQFLIKCMKCTLLSQMPSGKRDDQDLDLRKNNQILFLR